MAGESQQEAAPLLIEIPDELRDFLEVVHILAGELANGTYQLKGEEDRLVWGDITWSRTGVFCKGMIGFPDEDLSEFDFKYSLYIYPAEWEFNLSRQEIAQIAAGEVRHLALYRCAHPLCGNMSSERKERCFRCGLRAGADIEDPQNKGVRGVCPYCHKLLRTLYARQCPNCLMEWHDPDHPSKLGANT